MPCDFFTAAILPYLKPSQIDEMTIYNKGLNKLIDRKRIDLPRTPVDELNIEGSEPIIYGILDDFVNVEVVNNNYMVHIKRLHPKFLILGGDVKYENLDVRWLKTIDLLAFRKIPESMTAEDFYRILQKFNASSIRLNNVKLKLNAEKVLESMPNLGKLEMTSVSISKTFHENVVRKSKLGGGIYCIILDNEESEPFETKQLIHIIENATFKHRNVNFHLPNEEENYRNIDIECVTGSEDQLAEELMKLTRKKGLDSVV